MVSTTVDTLPRGFDTGTDVRVSPVGVVVAVAVVAPECDPPVVDHVVFMVSVAVNEEKLMRLRQHLTQDKGFAVVVATALVAASCSGGAKPSTSSTRSGVTVSG